MSISISKEDIITLEKLEGLCRIDPKSVIDSGLMLLSKYDENTRKEELARLYKCIGFSYCFISKFEDAIKNSSIALDGYLNKENKQGVTECYFNIGTIYFYAGNYSLALVNYKKALDISSSEKDEIRMANAYNGIGSVYYSLHRNEDSINYLSKALSIAERFPEKALTGRIVNGLAQASLNLRDYNKAIEYAEYSLTMYDGISDIAFVNKVLAAAHFGKGLDDDSLNYYHTALELLEKLGNEKEVLTVKIEIAAVNIKRGKQVEAKKILIECDKVLAVRNYYELEKELINNLIRLTKANKDKNELEHLFERLSSVQNEIIESHSRNNGELIGLSESVSLYENLELKKKAEQLEQTNKSLKTLTQIGEEIASITGIEELIEKIYEKLNSLLEASVLAISIYNKESDELIVPLTIEKGEKLGSARISLSDTKRLAVICFKGSQEIVINNFDEEIGKYIEKYHGAYIGETPESLIYLPLKFKGHTIGTLSVQSFEKNAYSEEKVEILRNLSIYISIAVENAFLLNNLEEKVTQRTLEVNEQKEKLEQSHKNISKLNEIGKTITTSLSVEEIIEKALSNIDALMPAEAFGIGLYNQEKQALEKIIVEEGQKNYITDYLTEDVYAVQCYKSKRPKIINKENRDKEAETISIVSHKNGKRMNSIIYYPLISNEKCFGVITVQSTAFAAYTESHIQILEILASYTAIALQNARIYQEVETTVTERTKEINSAYQETNLLSQIGKEITSCLSIDQIIETVYEKVNHLMEAPSMNLGLYDKEKKQLFFPGTMEKGVKFNTHYATLDETYKMPIVCFNQKREILVNDMQNEAKLYTGHDPIKLSNQGEIVDALIYLPLLHKEEAIGVISVQSFTKNVYTQHHLDMLRNIAIYVSIAVENAQLYQNMEEEVKERTVEVVKQKEEIEKSYKDVQLLSKIGQEITASLKAEEIISRSFDFVRDLMNADVFGIALLSGDKKSLNMYAREKDTILNYSIELITEKLAAVCFINIQDIVLHESKDILKYFPEEEYVNPAGDDTESVLYLPIIHNEKCIGVITVQSFLKNVFQKQQILIVKNLATYAAVALENAKAYENLQTLSLIGKEVTSSLNLESVLGTLYQNINKLMDAYTFLITSFDKNTNEFIYELTIENDQRILKGYRSLLQDEKSSFSSWCYHNKKDVFINDAEKETGLYVDTVLRPTGENPGSIIFIPLIIEGEVIGLLSVQSIKNNAYTKQHLEILKSLASFAAVALNNAESFNELEIKRKDLENSNENLSILSDLGKQITSSLDFSEVLHVIYTGVNKLLDATIFGISLYDKNKKIIDHKFFIEKGERLSPKSIPIDYPNSLAAWSVKNKKEIFISDIEKEIHNYVNKVPQIYLGESPLSLIYLPLFAGEEVIGVITTQSLNRNAYSSYDFQILKTIGSYAAVALANAQVYEEVEHEVELRTEQIKKAHTNAERISEVGKQMTSTLDLDQVLDIFHTNIGSFMEADCIGVRLVNKTKNVFECKYEVTDGLRLAEFTIDIGKKNDFSNWVLENHREIFINEYEIECENYGIKKGALLYGKLSESIIFLPLELHGEILGVITIQSYNKNAFTDYHLNILKTLAIYTSIAIYNASSFERVEEEIAERTQEVVLQKNQLEKVNNNIQLLNKIGQEITSVLSYLDIINIVYNRIKGIFDINGFGIGIYNEIRNTLDFPGFIEKGELLSAQEVAMDSDRMAIHCFKNQEEIIVLTKEEIFKYVKGKQNPIEGEYPLSIIYVPILSNEKCIGVMTIQSLKEYAFTQDDINLFRNLASYVAVAIDNSKSFENLQTLSKIGKDVSSTFSIEQIADMLYESVGKLMDASSFLLATFDNQRKTIKHVRLYEDDQCIYSDLEYHIEKRETLAVYCVQNKAEVLINNHTEVLNYISHSKPTIGKPAESIIYIPLLFQNEVVGLFSVQSFKQNVYNKQHVEVLKNIASYLSVALNNALSHKQLREIGEIGQEITALNSIAEINQLVYYKLQSVMSLNGVGVGIYNQITNSLDFHNYFEDGKELNFHSEKLTDERYSVVCFKNQETIHINNNEDGQRYFKGEYITIDGDKTESIVYIPLMQKNKCIGALTVQAFAKNVFSKQDVSLVQNLAPYLAVAMENANSFKNLTQLSVIGKEVTSLMDMGKVIDILHERLSSFLDTTVLLVGLYDERSETVNLVKVYEEGKVVAENSIRDVNDMNTLSSFCIKNKKEIATNTNKEITVFIPNFNHNQQEGKEPESIIYLPLIFEEKVIGVLSVQSFNTHAYSKEHLEILRNVASYLTVTINNIKSYETLNFIGKIGQQITSTLNLKSVFATIYEGLNKLLDASFFIIALYDKQKEQVIYRYLIEEGEIQNKEIVIDVNNENYPGGWAIRNRKIIHLNDLLNEYHPYVKELKITNSSKVPNSVIYKPLIYENEVIGLISVQSLKKNAYGLFELQIIDSLSSYATSALQNGVTYEALERTKAEMEKLSIVASETDNAIIIANNKGEIEWVNEAFTEMTGFTLNDLLERNKTTIQSMSTFEGISEKLIEVFQRKESVNYEGVFTDKLGQRRFVQTTLTPILDEKKEIYKLIAIDADITFQKLAELEIREKNKDITDSINYAKRIQTAMLPSTSFIKSSLPDSFIYYEPRDIVSGDFYWMTKTIEDEIIIAAADCTGHGVPGAFLTIVGNNLLNQIVNAEGETSPGKILEKMNLRLLERFSGNMETRIKDGMDISICKLKKQNESIQVTYSGAFNAMYYVVEGELFELNANRFAIGTPIEDKEIVFEEYHIELNKNSMIYLFSDGYSDQLGGPKGKKYMKKRFKEFLADISENTTEEQHAQLKKNLLDWSGENQQVDDVLVIGIKI